MAITLNALPWAPFAMTDILRRAQGEAIEAFGLGPNECPYRVIAAGPHWRLRRYGHNGTGQSLLVVAAPIKRPYIWDLSPSVSAISYCLQQGLDVYLLEWLPALRRLGNNGLDEYALAISQSAATICSNRPAARPVLIGHSLGGTLAAIASALTPESVLGLVLLGTPLSFEPQTSRFRDALVSLVPSIPSEIDPVPGSLLSQVSALADPKTFVWSRLIDAAQSGTDRDALDVHARIERWALDEMPLPAKLVRQIIVWLYRENAFHCGALNVGGTRLGPTSLAVPTLAVVNVADAVAPPASITPFIRAMPIKDVRTIEYPGEIGVCLQHLGILVGRQARARVWPEIISWLHCHR
jgi:polyhydroxyalkanoate synthase